MSRVAPPAAGRWERKAGCCVVSPPGMRMVLATGQAEGALWGGKPGGGVEGDSSFPSEDNCR